MSNHNVIAERPGKKIFVENSKLVKLFDAGYSKADILNEALNQARVEETDLNIPKIQSVSVVDGCWSISMDYIEGTTLEQLMAENPEKLDEYLNLFVDVQLNIHSKRVPLLNMLIEKMNRKISAADLDATTRYDLHTRLNGMKRHIKLCHGDFNPSNVIITADGTPYVIDWAHATQGNAAADVARTYLLFYLQGKPDVAEKYLKLFCKKADTAIQYVQKWIPIVAASRLVKAPEEEKEFLMKWINVVDYE
ncbi:MAG TPA: aminoglycoside phosphotransferase family protein [Candidatus Coproplasma excrementigallinarum]|uniref:Aminoglycoside phosphotransferase family protein n=1 Tax=Candidatus Coproplasma excrementigallinarum TaxID=2840747 RepID=A0A9D1MJ91_9FIRM|nr:aminoglycoside phosphotransferase family protein [Candidatus Coproplasma excrementigallinarum]